MGRHHFIKKKMEIAGQKETPIWCDIYPNPIFSVVYRQQLPVG